MFFFSQEEIIYEDERGNYLTQKPFGKGGYQYCFYDKSDFYLGNAFGETDLGELKMAQLKGNLIFKQFQKAVGDLDAPAKPASEQPQQLSMFDTVRSAPASTKPRAPTYNRDYYGSYGSYFNYPAAKTGYLEKCNKSDTLVFHLNDSSTTMLRQLYEGRGYDVINDGYVDKNEIHQLIQSHDKIMCLGHGTAGGLIGGNIGPQEAPYLADKKLFVIWCNADQFFTRYLPDKHGFYCTGNLPSDSNEARWVGCHVTEPYMNENITYWCKLCADVAEQALSGDAEGAVAYIREKYWEKYGEGYDPNDVPADAPDTVKITKYNYDRTKVQ